MLSLRGISSLALFLLTMSIAYGATLDRVQHNVEYSKVAGAPLYLDAAIPEGTGPHPAAIIVHGGGWVRGDRRFDVAPLFAPLEQAGIAWFSIDYRLSDEITQFGAAIEDVQNAIRFIKAHAAKYRIDPDRIALIGESAGGQLAAMAALNPEPGARVKAMVALYAPTDLVQLARNSSLVPKQIRDSIHGTPFEGLILARLGQLSPVDNVKPDAPSFLLIHGTADRLVPFSQSVAMCNRLKQAGATCDLYPVQGGGHGIRWWESSNPRGAAAYKQEMVRWLSRQLAAGHASRRS
jgi:acetyl esterase